jgi:hypothetical protein
MTMTDNMTKCKIGIIAATAFMLIAAGIHPWAVLPVGIVNVSVSTTATDEVSVP